MRTNTHKVNDHCNDIPKVHFSKINSGLAGKAVWILITTCTQHFRFSKYRQMLSELLINSTRNEKHRPLVFHFPSIYLLHATIYKTLQAVGCSELMYYAVFCAHIARGKSVWGKGKLRLSVPLIIFRIRMYLLNFNEIWNWGSTWKIIVRASIRNLLT